MKFTVSLKYLAFYASLFLLGVGLESKAQGSFENPRMQQEFSQAMEFLQSFKNDSAKVILSQLIHDLCETKELNTPFGLNVQLRYAEALEKDEENEMAIEKLLQIGERSKDSSQWDVLTHAYLSLARLYEKLKRDKSCKYVLRQASSTINTHQLDSIYPRFSIRASSYHRFYGDKDSARYFASEVIRTAPQFGLEEEKAVGNLLMGILLDNSHFKEIVTHFTLAGNHWKKVEDYMGYGSIMKNISKLHIQRNNFKQALRYNDTALVAYHKAAKMGHEHSFVFHSSYKDRSAILKELGQLDSALYYLQKGYEIELEAAYQDNKEKVIEIDAKYKDEKKAQKIQEQAHLIVYERKNRNLLLGVIFLVLLFATALIYYSLRLRTANQKTREQAVIITKANENLSASLQQQIMLQGEVHHRVKNNLQVLISLLELQSEDIQDPQALKNLETMSHRIYSMAAIHEILYQKEGAEVVKLLDYTQNLCQHFSSILDTSGKPVFQLDMQNQAFNLETLMPLGIILNELITNSLKYATRIGEQLKIHISLLPHSDGYYINYKDNGPGFPAGNLKERDGGLGTYLLKSMCRQLHGHLESRNENGAVYKVFFKEKNPIEQRLSFI